MQSINNNKQTVKQHQRNKLSLELAELLIFSTTFGWKTLHLADEPV